MHEIVIEAWEELSRLRQNSVTRPYIVDTMPILYFGDQIAYSESEIKVVTVGINPSDTEFRDDAHEGDEFFRFPRSAYLRGVNQHLLTDNQIQSYLESLNDYFDLDKEPYWSWFKKNEPLINGIGASYLPKGHPERPKNCLCTAIHTDICSPIATDPVWGGLSSSVKKVLLERGRTLWLQLIESLQPDIILVSGGDYLKIKSKPLNSGLKPLEILEPTRRLGVEPFKAYVHRAQPNKDSGEYEKLTKPYQVELHQYRLNSGKVSSIFYGNSANGWFSTVGNRKYELGKEIRYYWRKDCQLNGSN